MDTLKQVLEIALELPYRQQKMLIRILQNHHHERCREDIAAEAQQALADFHADKFQHQSAENGIAVCVSLCKSQKCKAFGSDSRVPTSIPYA
jgi:hypothetical protein